MPTTTAHWGWEDAWALIPLAVAWHVLSGGAPESWLIGAPAIGACVFLLHRLPSEGRWRWSARGIVQFIPYFIWQSVRSGVQVAGLAIHPRTLLKPDFFFYDTRLSSSPARVFFANSISLLPGTLSCILTRDFVVVHSLSSRAAVEPELIALERRVARLFGLDLENPEAPADA